MFCVLGAVLNALDLVLKKNPWRCSYFYCDWSVDENTKTHEGDACPTPLVCRRPESCLTPKPMLPVICYKLLRASVGMGRGLPARKWPWGKGTA